MTTQAKGHNEVAKRTDIQAFRFIAVVLVVFFHAGVPGLSGGFIGVDVFFVISGYLIIGGVFRTIDQGAFRITSFFARRFIRLLPASLVALLLTAASTLALNPLSRREYLIDIGSAAAYVANIRFMLADTGYFADSQPSPVIHYWSLSLEEQFYILVPVLTVLCLRISKNPKRAITALLALSTITSLALSIWLTGRSPNAAYYFLATRLWELGCGGMLYILCVAPTNRWIGRLTSSCGMALIAIPAFAYSESTPFPGWTATLPVIGTCLLIYSGNAGQWGKLTRRVIEFRFIQHTGNLSYSWYLWHWPVLTLLPLIVGGSSVELVCIGVALSWALAHYSYTWVEKPSSNWARTRAPKQGHYSRLVVAGLASSLLVAGTSFSWASQVSLTSDRYSPTSKSAQMTKPSFTPKNVSSPLTAPSKAEIYSNKCHELSTLDVDPDCIRGDPQSDTTWVLAGDSHAAQWTPALDVWAKKRGVRLIVLYKNGCPAVPLRLATNSSGRNFPDCELWQSRVQKTLSTSTVDGVIVGSYLNSYIGHLQDPHLEMDDAYASAFSSLQSAVRAPILTIADNAHFDETPLRCLSGADTNAARCWTKPAGIGGEQWLKKRNLIGDGVISMDPWLCPDGRCYAISESTLLYRDMDHLTPEATIRLAPALAQQLNSMAF